MWNKRYSAPKIKAEQYKYLSLIAASICEEHFRFWSESTQELISWGYKLQYVGSQNKYSLVSFTLTAARAKKKIKNRAEWPG